MGRGIQGSLLLGFFLLVSFSNGAEIKRSDFPQGFMFGSSSSAYQIEGGAKEGGKGPSMWDTTTHKNPETITDGSNGDVAIDSYHRYKDDVSIMKDLGMDSYRFSISWTRILPGGHLSGGINEEGIRYYNNLIDELISNGITPVATLFHWDSPQALEDEYSGFLSSKIVDDFRDYVNICFEKFGDRVKHWITVNEPWTFSVYGYDLGILAPWRCSSDVGNCSNGDSSTEPYVVAHNLLLSHAAAVKLYKEKYQANQKGVIGIALNSKWVEPFSKSITDRLAAKRALDFLLGWYMEPLTRGEYPLSMRFMVKHRLPRFTKQQSQMLKGSFDFIGINYYTSNYALQIPTSNNMPLSYSTDSRANLTGERNGKLIGPQGGSSWLYVYPRGIRDLLVYIKRRYNNPLIIITENGVDEKNNKNLSVEEALQDNMRVNYYREHLTFLHNAIIRDDVNVKGYFAWSLFDNFEWSEGYTVRFGINYVDFDNGLKRYPKRSALWFKNFLKREGEIQSI